MRHVVIYDYTTTTTAGNGLLVGKQQEFGTMRAKVAEISAWRGLQSLISTFDVQNIQCGNVKEIILVELF